MDYFTSDVSHLKREIVKFSYKMTNNCRIVDSNLLLDIIYGILASKDIKIMSFTRVLYENINYYKTVRRLSTRLKKIDDIEIIKDNFRKQVVKYLPEKNILVIFDDSDIVKIYGKKFEDLDNVIDGSDLKKQVKPGYHVCNACIISRIQKQPIEVFSKIYSTKSKDFISMNTVTNESIEEVTKIVGTKFTGIFDRGYDDEKIFRKLNNQGTKFVVRLTTKRKMLFKNKKKKVIDAANNRKGKYKMKVLRSENGYQEIYVSYTRAKMIDKDREEFDLVFAYGLGKEPMMIITNIDVKDGNDAIKIVRMYIERWKIEEIHRSEKKEYNYEDMRVRSLLQLNNLNFIFMITLFFIVIQIEKMNKNLLSIEIILRSKSLKTNISIWFNQYARGIKEILSYSKTGVLNFKKREIKTKESIEIENELKYEQLELFEDVK